MRLLKYSKIESISKSRKCSQSSPSTPFEPGMRWRSRTSARPWTWRDFSSRKTKSKKWKAPTSSLNFIKGSTVYSTAVKPNSTCLSHSKTEDNFSKSSTVSKQVQEPSDAWTGSSHQFKPMTFTMSRSANFTLWWFSPSKTKASVRKCIQWFIFTLIRTRWVTVRR